MTVEMIWNSCMIIGIIIGMILLEFSGVANFFIGLFGGAFIGFSITSIAKQMGIHFKPSSSNTYSSGSSCSDSFSSWDD